MFSTAESEPPSFLEISAGVKILGVGGGGWGEKRPCKFGSSSEHWLERVVCDAFRERRANHSDARASLSRLLESRRVLERLGGAPRPPAHRAAGGQSGLEALEGRLVCTA